MSVEYIKEVTKEEYTQDKDSLVLPRALHPGEKIDYTLRLKNRIDNPNIYAADFTADVLERREKRKKFFVVVNVLDVLGNVFMEEVPYDMTPQGILYREKRRGFFNKDRYEKGYFLDGNDEDLLTLEGLAEVVKSSH